MTSEPDSNPGRRPPTIELKATEVEQPDAPAPSGGNVPPARRAPESSGQTSAGPQPSAAPSSASTGRLKTHAVSAIVGAVAVAAIVAGLWAAGFVPSRPVAAPPPAAAPETSAATQPAPSNAADLAARLDKLERIIQAQRNQPSAPDRVAAAQTQTKALSDSLAALSRRVDDIAATSQSAAKTGRCRAGRRRGGEERKRQCQPERKSGRE